MKCRFCPAPDSDICVGLKIGNYADVAAQQKKRLNRETRKIKTSQITVSKFELPASAFAYLACFAVQPVLSAAFYVAISSVWNLNCFSAGGQTTARKIMETIDTLKLEIKKLSSQAIQAKMDLHDLSEELPANWERIPEVAQKTFQIYEKLIAVKQRLAAMGG